MGTLNRTTETTFAITTGGVAQTVLAANNRRESLVVQNKSNFPMQVRFGANPTVDSLELERGQMFSWADKVPIESVVVLCATTGAKGVIEEGSY